MDEEAKKVDKKKSKSEKPVEPAPEAATKVQFDDEDFHMTI